MRLHVPYVRPRAAERQVRMSGALVSAQVIPYTIKIKVVLWKQGLGSGFGARGALSKVVQGRPNRP